LKTPAILILAIVGIIFIGFSFNSADAELTSNNAFVLEGSGFAVTEKEIKNTQIDFVITTGDIRNGRGTITFEDGFVTLDNDDFISDNIVGTILRDGSFLRISGTADDASGDELNLRLFGRLIEDSEGGSIYSFTGRLTQDNIEYKIIYTSKLSGFDTGILTLPTTSTEPEENTIHILQGSSSQSVESYIGVGGAAKVAGYFSVDRLAIEPGTTVTFVNDDSVSHTIVSGSGLGTHSSVLSGSIVLCAEDEVELLEGFSFSQTGCDFTFDGKINTGELLPGESTTVTFEDSGFYRILDPNYPWMSLTVYSFPNIDSLVIGTPGESFN
jgi:plastocyanin